jgi:hypothetical protein
MIIVQRHEYSCGRWNDQSSECFDTEMNQVPGVAPKKWAGFLKGSLPRPKLITLNNKS